MAGGEAAWADSSPVSDLVIRNGRVLDGEGSPWIAADVAIKDGRHARHGSAGAGMGRPVTSILSDLAASPVSNGGPIKQGCAEKRERETLLGSQPKTEIGDKVHE
jgi:hypothetical protein